MRLEGKVAIVTGGARGFGEAIARLFVSEGAKVVIVDILDDLGRALEAELNQGAKNALYCHADVGDVNMVKATVAKTIETFAKIDVMVNNAGIRGGKGFTDELPDEDWIEVINVNLSGTYWFCKYVIPHFIRQGGGAIVNIASMNSFIAMEKCVPYTASKAGVLGLTRAIAMDYGKDNIRINAICPGVCDTEMVLQSYKHLPNPEEAMNQKWAARHPLGRMGHADDVAKAALFLASDDSCFTTGSALMVDGGYTIV